MDDSYFQGSSEIDCKTNIEQTIFLLRSLGFVIHHNKSVLRPTQQIEFLGFVLNSIDMTIALTKHKRD